MNSLHRLVLSSSNALSRAGFHTSRVQATITKFGMPAMSPTMTEGTVTKWKKSEGESVSAGDVLLEVETDKAQIDVEATEDGILAKILVPEGKRVPVNTLIALIAEEGDDLSNIEIPSETTSITPAAEAPKAEAAPAPAPVASTPSEPLDPHAIDTKSLKKPLSPAVLSLILKHHIADPSQIKASGPGGRILKGDVLAHLGLIPFKPFPKPNNSAAPPRDQIVLQQPAKKPEAAVAAAPKPVVPNFISKRIFVDDLLKLRRTLNDQHNSSVTVDDFIAKAASRALQDVFTGKSSINTTKSIVKSDSKIDFSDTYKGGLFNIFNLAEPTYDFISDSYQPSKPYTLTVSASQKASGKSEPTDITDLIGYLGGESPKPAARPVKLASTIEPLTFTPQPNTHSVELKLAGGEPGKIVKDAKATVFLDRLEYYVSNPQELVA